MKKSYRSDKISFMRDILGLNPHPTQIEVLNNLTNQNAIVTGRQWGKSTAMAADATWFSVTHEDRMTMIIGPSLEQARIIFNEIERYFQQPPLSLLVKGKPKSYPFPEIRLLNGSVLTARGGNSPQFIRGNRVHRGYIDEAAFIKDSVITDVIMPMFTVTGKTEDSAEVYISTPFGRGAFFDLYNAGLESETGFNKAFHYTSYDNPYADVARLELIKQRYGEDSLLWRTEYLGLFDVDDRAVFPWADIKAAYEAWEDNWKLPADPIKDHHYVQGVDLANMRDFFVDVVLDDTDPNHVILSRLDRFQKRGYPFYKATVTKNRNRYRIAHGKTLIDATSLGESVVDDLPFAEGYKFGGQQAKWEVVQELARMLSEHRLIIPFDRTIIDELKYFEYQITNAKNIRMEAAQGHDDIVMALALGAHLASIPRRLGLMRAASTIYQPPKISVRTPRAFDDWAAMFAEE